MCLVLKFSLLTAGGEARPLRERTRTRSKPWGGRYLEDHPSEEVVYTVNKHGEDKSPKDRVETHPFRPFDGL